MALAIPNRFYDYVLYYECGSNEKNKPSLWTNIKNIQPGSLLSGVKWNSTGNDVGDGAGITRFGVTGVAIQAYKNWSRDSNFKLNCAQSWVKIVDYFWKESHAVNAANVACGIILCQGRWGSWGNSSINSCCNELRKRANNQTQAQSIKGSGYSVMSKLTHCFTNPMDAFIILRSFRISYLRSCKNASKFAGGWMRREFFAMQKDGLYCEPGSKLFTKYGNTPISEMEKVATSLKQNPSSGYTCLMKWDSTPSSDLSLEGLDSGGDVGNNDCANISPIDGGEFNQGLNKNNTQKGLIVGITINQK